MHYNKRCSITHSHSTLLLSSRISLSLSPPPLSLFQCAALAGHIFSGPPSYCLVDLSLHCPSVRPSASVHPLTGQSSPSPLGLPPSRLTASLVPLPPLPLPLSPDERASRPRLGNTSNCSHEQAKRPSRARASAPLALFTGVPFGVGGDGDWPLRWRPSWRPWSFIFTSPRFPAPINKSD